MKTYTLKQIHHADQETSLKALMTAFTPLFGDAADMMAERCHNIGLLNFIKRNGHNPACMMAIEAFIDGTIKS